MVTASAPNKKRSQPDDRRPIVDRSRWPTACLDTPAARALDWITSNFLPSFAHIDLNRTDSVNPLLDEFCESGPASPVRGPGSDVKSHFTNIARALVQESWTFYRAACAGSVEAIRVGRSGKREVPLQGRLPSRVHGRHITTRIKVSSSWAPS